NDRAGRPVFDSFSRRYYTHAQPCLPSIEAGAAVWGGLDGARFEAADAPPGRVGRRRPGRGATDPGAGGLWCAARPGAPEAGAEEGGGGGASRGGASKTGAAPAAKVEAKGTVTIVQGPELRPMDPTIEIPSTTNTVLNVYDPLLWKGDDLKLRPHLAEAWKVE